MRPVAAAARASSSVGDDDAGGGGRAGDGRRGQGRASKQAAAAGRGHPRADAFTWSAAMTACIEAGEWERAVGMLKVGNLEGGVVDRGGWARGG